MLIRFRVNVSLSLSKYTVPRSFHFAIRLPNLNLIAHLLCFIMLLCAKRSSVHKFFVKFIECFSEIGHNLQNAK